MITYYKHKDVWTVVRSTPFVAQANIECSSHVRCFAFGVLGGWPEGGYARSRLSSPARASQPKGIVKEKVKIEYAVPIVLNIERTNDLLEEQAFLVVTLFDG